MDALPTQQRSFFSRELIVSYIFVALAWVICIATVTSLPNEIPLWYSYAVPEQQLVPKLFIFIFPLIMLGTTVLHTTLSKRMISIDEPLMKIFSYSTTLISFLFFVGLIHILSLFFV